jgi:uracil-DNA glycosylase
VIGSVTYQIYKRKNNMLSIQEIIQAVKKEAERQEFPVDAEVYKACGMDANEPVLFYGDLKSPLCFFARDLGKDEVKAKQPLYGAAGTLVRKGVYEMLFDKAGSGAQELQKAADRVLLTNTVPYKPVGNKAYTASVKKRFRPFLEHLLVNHWQGTHIISLGTEAFEWFTPYTSKSAVEAFFARADRYSSELPIILTCAITKTQKNVLLAPLPHPSPLNQQYYEKFPEMLKTRLAKIKPLFSA